MKNKKADYIVTGQWAKKAFQEAKIYGEAVNLHHQRIRHFSYIPDCSDLPISPMMRIMYISARTIPSTEQNSRHFPTPRVRHLYQMYLHAFCQSPWM